ncbi:MAG: DUF4139 domain-containing protein [Treponema sp.]|jgi:hypothetical protein|nr:DUF4139 domain-containing protein [Treponema sp.]
MMNKKNRILFFAFLLLIAGMPVYSQAVIDRRNSAAASGNASNTVLPLRKLTIFSSGMGLFEHRGSVSSTAASPALVKLPFTMNAVNDALMSLVVNDPRSDFPTVSYASASALHETLRSLKIDLSGYPGTDEILASLRGADIEISAPNPIEGRILGVEYRPAGEYAESWLSLYTSSGIRTIALKDISSFAFKDAEINADMERALDLLLASRDSNSRELILSLPGEGSRDVALSYVIPVPVWKASYRLDLGSAQNRNAAGSAFFQGWAIIDNDSDTDWNNVELSLVSGRPTSFIQNLYAPYHTHRPTLPLSIAGIAESRTYESGNVQDSLLYAKDASQMNLARSRAETAYEQADGRLAGTGFASAAPAPSAYQSAQTRDAGAQFEFTLKNRVSIERRKSAMLPLVETNIKAEKKLIFSGANAVPGVSMNPAVAAELTNTAGIKLPAGPITVYDDGSYAGDALIEFLPENEKRLISYGDDLSVSGSVSAAVSRLVSAVNISRGVMTITRRQTSERIYTVRNASAENKQLVIEHPVTVGASLSEPVSYDERTPAFYRFNRTLQAKAELQFTVKEEMPLSERITLSQLRPDAFVSYTTNQEIPANVRAALQRAVELKQKADGAAAAKQDIENQCSRLVSEQDRIRRNLEAAGNQTPQGQEYLRRMAALDSEIDALNKSLSNAEAEVRKAGKDYEDYLMGLNL